MVSVLPFDTSADADHQERDPLECPLFKTLPEELQEGAHGHPHLLKYLHMLPVADHGIPDYREELTRADGDRKEPNVIYPVGRFASSSNLPNLEHVDQLIADVLDPHGPRAHRQGATV